MNTIEVMKQARDALEMWITPNWAGSGVDKANAAHAALEQAIQQEEANIQTQITKDILRPVKTYSGGKAWPVQKDQVCPQKICWTPYDCENGRCTGSEKNEPIGRFNGKFRAGDGKMFFEVEVSDEKSLPAVFALIYTTPPKG